MANVRQSSMSAVEPHIMEEINAINDAETSSDSDSDPLDDVVDIQTSANKNNSFTLTKVRVRDFYYKINYIWISDIIEFIAVAFCDSGTNAPL